MENQHTKGNRISGFVDNYFSARGFGFIAGEDGESYFFHIHNIDAQMSEQRRVETGCKVTFAPSNSRRGLSAKEIGVLSSKSTDASKYSMPEKFLTSSGADIVNHKVLQSSSYYIIGSTTSAGESPEKAKEDAIKKAQRIGANALIHLKRSSGTGEDGNYKYTTHHYTGRAVVVGKPSLHHGKEEGFFVKDMDETVETLLADEKSSRSVGWTVIMFLVAGITAYAWDSFGEKIGLFTFGGSLVVSYLFLASCCKDISESYISAT